MSFKTIRTIYVDGRIWKLASEKARMQGKSLSQVIEELLKRFVIEEQPSEKEQRQPSLLESLSKGRGASIREVEGEGAEDRKSSVGYGFNKRGSTGKATLPVFRGKVNCKHAYEERENDVFCILEDRWVPKNRCLNFCEKRVSGVA